MQKSNEIQIKIAQFNWNQINWNKTSKSHNSILEYINALLFLNFTPFERNVMFLFQSLKKIYSCIRFLRAQDFSQQSNECILKRSVPVNFATNVSTKKKVCHKKVESKLLTIWSGSGEVWLKYLISDLTDRTLNSTKYYPTRPLTVNVVIKLETVDKSIWSLKTIIMSYLICFKMFKWLEKQTMQTIVARWGRSENDRLTKNSESSMKMIDYKNNHGLVKFSEKQSI